MSLRGASAVVNRASRIRSALNSALQPLALEIEDVSHQHAGHAAMKDIGGAGETHFNLLIVSDKFQGLGLVKRHRMVYDALTSELNSGLHALSIVAKTPDERSASS